MTDGIRIRTARMNDVPALLHYAHAMFSERLPTLFDVDPLPDLRAEEAFVRPYVERPGWVLFLALEGRRVVGLLSFKRHDHPQLCHGGELGISLLDGWRGRGVGTRLLQAVEEWAPRHQLRRLELQVFENNTGAIRLYERLGYEHEGRRRGAVKVQGRYLDILLMVKRIDPVAARMQPRSRRRPADHPKKT
ncbi:MAG: GNAT family protein [Candidatus Krumholzibacteriia bacterium]